MIQGCPHSVHIGCTIRDISACLGMSSIRGSKIGELVALTGHFANQCNAAMTEVLEYLDTL